MALIFGILALVTFVYIVLMLLRLAFNWVQVFARDWTPRGWLVVLVESVFTATDPPLRAVGRVVPPLRIGPVALDLAFMIVMFGLFLLMSLFQSLASV